MITYYEGYCIPCCERLSERLSGQMDIGNKHFGYVAELQIRACNGWSEHDWMA